jgi:hypothetical protein
VHDSDSDLGYVVLQEDEDEDEDEDFPRRTGLVNRPPGDHSEASDIGDVEDMDEASIRKLRSPCPGVRAL